MKFWDALTDEAKDWLLMIGFFVECYVLFVVMA